MVVLAGGGTVAGGSSAALVLVVVAATVVVGCDGATVVGVAVVVDVDTGAVDVVCVVADGRVVEVVTGKGAVVAAGVVVAETPSTEALRISGLSTAAGASPRWATARSSTAPSA